MLQNTLGSYGTAVLVIGGAGLHGCMPDQVLEYRCWERAAPRQEKKWKTLHYKLCPPKVD